MPFKRLCALLVLALVPVAASAAPLTIASLSPDQTYAGGSSFLLGVSGTGFVDGVSLVYWNGVPQSTTYATDTFLTTIISSTLIAFPGTALVQVANPGAETSNSLPFEIASQPPPTPIIQTVTPSSTVAGSSGFELQLYGYNFLPNSLIQWNGTDRFTTFLSAAHLSAAILASDLAIPGIVELTVRTSGVVSSPYSFTIASSEPPSNPVPEPGSPLLFVIALGAVAAARKRMR